MCSIIVYVNINSKLNLIRTRDDLLFFVNLLKLVFNRGNDNFGLLIQGGKVNDGNDNGVNSRADNIINNNFHSIEEIIDFINKNYSNYSNYSNFFNLFDLNNSKFNGFNSIFLHGLFSLVNFVEQPLFFRDRIFLSNCEIYNWKFLNEKYDLNSRNDSEVLFNLINKFGHDNLLKILEELDGVYAFVYKNEDYVYLVRDILGVKPLFYFYDSNNLLVASEKKVLINFGLNRKFIFELDPRKVLRLDLNSNRLDFIERNFFLLGDEIDLSYEMIKKETMNLLISAIKKRLPSNDKKIGLLFSGGIDSTFIAYVLKFLNVDFKCYTAKLEGGNIQEAEDLIYAREIAERYGFDLEVVTINILNLENEIMEVKKIIEDDDYIKISVALPFHLSSKLAKKDGIDVMFSGLGSEEIFAGYLRHRKLDNPNQECINGLLSLYYRDLYRDDTITMNSGIELRLPFLDYDLINYALNIPVKYKINLDENRSKIILRDIAKDMGLDIRYSERAKKAAQYGSKFDKGIFKLAKLNGLSKQDYVRKL